MSKTAKRREATTSKPPETLNSDEAFKLMTYLLAGYGDKKTRPIANRSALLALFMLDAGLRVGEVVLLKQSNLFINGEPVLNLDIDEKIARKGCTGLVPLSARIRTAILEMTSFWWPKTCTDGVDWAFYTANEKTHISVRQVQRIIGDAAQAAFGRKIHCHVLRHTFASNMARITNIRVVQSLLRHKQLSSTMIYTHPNNDDKTKAIRAMEGIT